MLTMNTTTSTSTVEERTDSATDMPSTMRAVVAQGYGGPEQLQIEDVAVPTPGEGELLVRTRASSLNALDWHFLTGTPYPLRLSNGIRRLKRTIPGADFAGTVVATGPGVTRFAPGDEIFGACEGGGCAPFVTVDASNVVYKPAGVSFEAAGATPIAGMTALQALRTHGSVQPGDHVLINGAAGGVGTFAVQIAKALGAEVTAVCSTRNVEMVRSLGADTVIDYTTSDFVDGGARFDVMMDNVGNRTPAECLSVLRPGARFVLLSGPKTNRMFGPVPHIARTALAFLRADPSFHQFTVAPNEADLLSLAEMLDVGSITPAIDRVVGLDGVAAGLAELGTGHTRAKIVVMPA